MTISKKNLYKWIYALIFLPLVVRFFTDNFGMPYTIMPLFDILAIITLILSYYLTRKIDKKVYILEFWLFLFFIAGLSSIIVNEGTTLSNIFYSSRPFFRMIIAMLASAIVFNLKDVERLYCHIEKILYLNAFVMTYQFVFQGLRQDIIGGTFGNNQGVNAIQNILCVFLFTVTVEFYLKRIISKRKLLINSIMVLYIAILAEINLVIFEVAIVGGILFLLNLKFNRKISVRMVFLISIGVIGVLGGVQLFMKFNPDRVFLLSFQNILEYIGFNSGNTGVYRISRVKVFSQLGDLFFGNDIKSWIFGYGLGNGSSHSEFYNLYQNIQYTFFSSANVFIETGLFGVVVNLGVIVTGMVVSLKGRRSVTDNNGRAWLDIAFTLSVIMALMFFYNTTLRDTYTAFFAGVVLAIPYIVLKNKSAN
ncbi:TPA: hypothetical protein ACGO4G_001073 [Streptococcus suis]